MAELDDIFSNNKRKLSDEELLQYLDGTASEQETHDIEKTIADSAFESEAVEGLEQFKKREHLNDYVLNLNKNLQQQLAQKKKRKGKRIIKEMPLAVITVIIILILCVLGYIAIHLFQKNNSGSLVPQKNDTAAILLIGGKSSLSYNCHSDKGGIHLSIWDTL